MKSAPAEAVWASDDGLSQVYHADAFAFLGSLPANSVDCVWTDPPYLLSNDGTTCVAGKRTTVNKGEWDRSQGLEIDHEFHRSWLSACHRVLKPNGTIWVTGTLHVYLSVGMAMLELGYRILNDITWEKPNPPPNLGCRCFTHSTETILWATKAPKGSAHKYTFNYADMREANGGKQMKSVWTIPAAGRDEKTFGKHPTQKPIALVDRCLRASTSYGDSVVDPFAGSGVTAVASLLLGRQFSVCEKEETYVDIAVRRLDSASGGHGRKPMDHSRVVSDIHQRRLLESRAEYDTTNIMEEG